MPNGPLLSWDLYMDHYNRMMRRMQDWQQLKLFSQRHNWQDDWNLEAQVLRKDKVVLVTDPGLTICFATANIVDMNGYQPHEIVGNKPSMFQGKKTSLKIRGDVRRLVSQIRPFHVRLVNYRKDGSLYHCSVEGYPVFNKKQQHTHFIAFEELIET